MTCTNQERASFAREALLAYSETKTVGMLPLAEFYDPVEDVLIDLLCDLMHFADLHRIDFQARITMAEVLYNEEKDEQEASSTAESKALDALEWIVEFMDAHPAWTKEYFTEHGECDPETQWLHEARAIVANLRRGS